MVLPVQYVFDGTVYGSDVVPALLRPAALPAKRTYEIWDLEGTPSAPLVRVVISKDGKISLFGSKSSGGYWNLWNYSTEIHLII